VVVGEHDRRGPVTHADLGEDAADVLSTGSSQLTRDPSGVGPGALPLMEHALTELLERRTGASSPSTPTERSAACPGPWAVEPRSCSPSSTTTARRPPTSSSFAWWRWAGGPRTRGDGRSAREVCSLDVNQQAMAAVIDPFGASRQLSFDRDTKTGHPSRFSGVSFPRTRRSPPAPGDHALRLLDTGEHVLRVAEREAPSRPPGLRLPRLIVFQQTRRTLGRRACSAPTRRGSRARPRRGRSGSRRR
jgi:hypothetical protein